MLKIRRLLSNNFVRFYNIERFYEPKIISNPNNKKNKRESRISLGYSQAYSTFTQPNNLN
jgi:hypothetical protein